MADEMGREILGVSFKASTVTAKTLTNVILAIIRNTKKIKHGKQKLNHLSRQGKSLSPVEITEKNIKSFKKVAKKYKIDFSLMQDKSEPNKWVIFFKAQDAEVFKKAFDEYIRQQKKEKKPSIRETLKRNKQKVQEKAREAKQRGREFEMGLDR